MAARGALVFFVPGKLTNPLNGAQGVWRRAARDRVAWRTKTQVAYLAVRPLPWPDPSQPKRVTLVAHTWNTLDADGLQAALKSVRDGLMDCALIQSDDPASDNIFIYEQRISRKTRGVQITVEPRELAEIRKVLA